MSKKKPQNGDVVLHVLLPCQLPIQDGDTIAYVLRANERPVEPSRLWQGKVLHIYRDRNGSIVAVAVVSLETGYEGLPELVYPGQIRNIQA